MPLNGLTAAFVTLLEEDVEKPSFEVAESPDKQTIIVKTAFENGQTILNKLKEVFKSHGHTAEHIPFQLQPIFVATSTASRSSGSNLIQDLDKFPKVNFPLVDLQNLTGKDIFERLFSEEVRASAGVIMSWQETRGQNDQPVYYYVCQNDLEVDLRTAQVKYFKRILSHATLKDLYIALAKEDFKPLSMPSADVEGNGPLSAHLDSLFSIRQESEVGGKFVIRFDCIGLVKCIIAPQFSVAFGAQLVDVNASSSSSSVVRYRLLCQYS